MQTTLTPHEILNKKIEMMNAVKNIVDGSKKVTMRHINRLNTMYNAQRVYFTFYNSGTTAKPTNHLLVSWGLYSNSESLLHLTFSTVSGFVEYLQKQIANLSHEIVLLDKQDKKYLLAINTEAHELLIKMTELVETFNQKFPEGVQIQLIEHTPKYTQLQQIKFYLNRK